MSGLKTYLRYDVRAYFKQYTKFDGKRVLDFGCNRANFIRFQPHDNYTGIDIKEDIINSNIAEFPTYKFYHYDGYNYMYNKNGKQSLVLETHYDVCVAFSVFTHMELQETINMIKILKKHSDKIYLSYYSNKDKFAYEKICWFRDLEPDMWHSISNQNVFYIKTDKLMWSFYDDDFLQKKLGGTLHPTSFPQNDIRGMQRCLVI